MDDAKVKVIVADSHEIVRDGIADRIREVCDGEIVGSAEDGYTLLKLCRKESSDIVIMDINLTRPSGKEVLVRIQSMHPEIKVIILSSDSSVTNAFLFFRKGRRLSCPSRRGVMILQMQLRRRSMVMHISHWN
ncbi:response regulator transcription factor [Yoonia sp. SS1-5]|uniref:Response regulator transcription factor n=1 Tax=Yoonia rhodophyticola TaxID=3137370 RepID=A0AAN0NK87_9RHOB